MNIRMIAPIAIVAALLSGVTATPAMAADAPVADVLDVDFVDGVATEHANALTATVHGAPTIALDADQAAYVGSFDGASSAISYPLDYTPITAEASFECVFRFDGDLPTTSEKDICSTHNAGGYSFNVSGSNAQFMVYTGTSYKTVTAPISADRWYHAMAVWNGSTVALYLDGELAASTAATGALRLPATAARRFYLGADPNASGNPEFWAPASVARARIFGSALTAEQVDAAYDEYLSGPATPAADVLDVDFDNGTAEDAAQSLPATESGEVDLVENEAIDSGTALFDGSAYTYPFSDQLSKLETSVSFECVFRFEGDLPASAEQSLCAMKESGGYAMVIYGDRLTFTAYIGGAYRQAAMTVEPDRWYHAVGTWDGSAVRLWVDGALVAETAATGTFGYPASTARNIVIGGDVSLSNGVQFTADAEISAARVYSTALQEDDIVALNRAEIGRAKSAVALQLAGTTPAAGSTVTGPTTLDVTWADPSIVSARNTTFTLDGDLVEQGEEVGEGLARGNHTLSVSARDVFGRTLSQGIAFTSTNVPGGGGTETGQGQGRTTLSVVATNPSGGDVTSTFYQADVEIAAAGEQGVLDAMPTVLDFEDPAAQPITSDLVPDDGETLASAATSGMPYQRFDLAVGTSTGQRVAWSGTTDPEREVALHAWNGQRQTWQEIGRSRGLADGTVQIAFTARQALVDNGTVHVLVTGDDPFADDIETPIRDSFENPDDYDFAIAHFTDTQYLSEGAVEQETAGEREVWSDAYRDIMRWIAANADDRKIAYAAHTGDIIEDWLNSNPTNTAAREHAREEFDFASDTQQILDDAGVVNGVTPGNHDNLSGSDNGPDNEYNRVFGPERYEALAATPEWAEYDASYHPWQADDNDNHYDLFTAGGLDFIALYLGYDVTDEEAAWANGVLAQYADRNAIVLTHAYNAPSTSPDGRGASFSHDGSFIYNSILKQNPNVSLVLSGHEHGVSIVVRTDVGSADNNVVELLADYQFYEVGSDELGLTDIGGYGTDTGLRFGSSFFRLLQFDVDRGELLIDTYSPLLDNFGATEYDTRGRYNGTEDDLTLPIQLTSRTTSFATDGLYATVPTSTVIGEATVRSGWPAEVEWTGLTAGQLYAWHAVSRDAEQQDQTLGGVDQFGVFVASSAGTDRTAPELTLPESTTLRVGDAFDALDGVSAIDDTDGDVLDRVVVTGAVDTATAGTYALTYAVSDANGNQTVASRAVTVRGEETVKQTPEVSVTAEHVGYGESADIQVSVSDGATGRVRVSVGDETYPVDLVDGVATATVSARELEPGHHSVVALYTGDADFEAAVGTTELTVDAIATSVELDVPASVTAIEDLEATITVAPSDATETVSGEIALLMDGREVARGDATADGTSTITVPAIGEQGTVEISAVYFGSTVLAGAESPTATVDVSKASTETRLTLSKSTHTRGSAAVKATVRVTGASSGTVLIRDGKREVRGWTVKNGKATGSLPKKLSIGKHTVRAVFMPTDSDAYARSTDEATLRVKR